MNFFKKIIFAIWIENFDFIFLKKLAIGNGKNRFWNLDWNLKILKYVTKIWNEKNWKFSFFKFGIFHFWNLKWKFLFKIFYKIWPYHQMEMKKQLKWINHIFRLCHRDKTSNNTRIPSIPPMHTTLYHMCKLCWYTINLSRWILSYWSFSNSGMGWYGPP
jgi:hypothetical protein